MGEFLSARSRHNEAAEVLIQAAEMDPNNVAWTVAAAHALHDASRNVEAEVYFRRAVNLFPMVSSFWNLCKRVNLINLLFVNRRIFRIDLIWVPCCTSRENWTKPNKFTSRLFIFRPIIR